MPDVVRVALAAIGVSLQRLGGCTRCDRRWFSHRRGDTGRQVMTVRLLAGR
jgi:copper oxidase (laccase) domain-containing protein